MIRCYCQISFGGFKTFRIKGEQDEALVHEVTSNNRYEFPDLCEWYFNHGGTKITYRYVDAENIALIVREMPGPGAENTAIQFVGNALEDRQSLDNLCAYIVCNLDSFQSKFASMFSIRGELRFDSCKLMMEIQNGAKFDCPNDLNIVGNANPIIFFVPNDENFLSDKNVILQTFKFLKLQGSVNTLSYSKLKKFAKTNDVVYLKSTFVRQEQEQKNGKVINGILKGVIRTIGKVKKEHIVYGATLLATSFLAYNYGVKSGDVKKKVQYP